MTHFPVADASTAVLAQLGFSAGRAIALGCAAALALSVFRVKATRVRLLGWSAVLYAALAMPLLAWMLPGLEVPAPAFLQVRALQHMAASAPQEAAVMSDRPVEIPKAKSIRLVAAASAPNRIPTNALQNTAAASPSAPTSWFAMSWSSISWSGIAAAIYFLVALILLVRFFVGLAFTRRLVNASHDILDPRVTTLLDARAQAVGIESVPKLLETKLISVPVTIGALHPSILLPKNWRAWDDAKLTAVIAHEVSHVARRDALTQRLSLLHRAIFWFSPMAWWLDRHLADLAEQASDEAALSCGADRNDYARTLLGFFEALNAAPGRVWWQGVAMAKAGQAEQRLERILSWRGAVTMSLKKSIVIATFVLAVPVIYLAASVRPAIHPPGMKEQFSQDQAPPAAPAAAPTPAPSSSDVLPPQPAPEPAATPEASSDMVPPPARPAPVAPIARAGRIPAVAPVVPIAPPAPLAAYAPVVASARQFRNSSRTGSSFSYGFDDEQRFVIVSGKSDSYTMSGDSEDIRHVQKLKKQIAGDFIWFERDEKSYVIRDQATIDRARKLWAPQEELGRKQEELGKQQEELGKQQEALGEKMERVQVKVPDMTAELDKLRAKLQKLGSSATMEQIGDLQSEIGELQSKIGEIQSQAGEEQSKLGEQQGALGEKQGKLGEQQGKLGEQQGELARQASKQMKQLLDEAIEKKIAQPEL